MTQNYFDPPELSGWEVFKKILATLLVHLLPFHKKSFQNRFITVPVVTSSPCTVSFIDQRLKPS